MEKLNLNNAVILVAGRELHPAERKSIQMLQEEVHRRTGLQWQEVLTPPSNGVPVVVVTRRKQVPSFLQNFLLEVPLAVDKNGSPAPEGYTLTIIPSATGPLVLALGNDSRGTLFAVGSLLQSLSLEPQRAEISFPLCINTYPRYSVRGHQLSYSETPNTYDAWNLKQFEQYIRELIIFGTNTIELTLPIPLDRAPGPLMCVPPRKMNIALSELLDSYDIQISLFAPITDGDVSKKDERETILSSRKQAFREMKRIDALFVPGGDPGDTPPQILMPFLKELAEVLREYHSYAEVWVSHQCFEIEERDYFYNYLQKERPDWLTGIVYGPWTRDTLEHTRSAVPSCYSIRHYPDITHTVRCQYPVPEWDPAFAQTLNREPINPRPLAQAHIHNLYAPLTTGFVTYSEGVNDDVNKFIWSALGWNPEIDVKQILREYARFFIGEKWAKDISDGLLALEKNWQGTLRGNPQIKKTFLHWQKLEKKVPTDVLKNWRFQQALFRAYCDAYIQNRLKFERDLEKEAFSKLEKALATGDLEWIKNVLKILSKADLEDPAKDLCQKIENLADSLFHNIGMQLSVKKHYAFGKERGAVLDTLRTPLNNRGWLEKELKPLLEEKDFRVRREKLEKILFWKNPSSAIFYDDLGNPSEEPHLVKGNGEKDPGFLISAQDEHCERPYEERISWSYQAQTLYDTPIKVRYEGLNPKLKYLLRVVYAGRFNPVMRLVANGKYQIHGPVAATNPPSVMEFEIPPQATTGGVLELAWYRADSKTRGPQVAEVWLLVDKEI